MKELRLLKPFMCESVGSIIRVGPAQAEILLGRGVAESLDAKPVKKSVEPAPVETPVVAEKPAKKGRFSKR